MCESKSDESNPVSCNCTSSTVNSVDFNDSYKSSDGEAYTGPVTRSWAKVQKVQMCSLMPMFLGMNISVYRDMRQ